MSKKPSKKNKAPASSGRSASNKPEAGLSRRGFLGSSAAAGGVALTGTKASAASRTRTLGPKKAAITLNVNGQDRALSVEPRVTLLRALRNDLDLTGPKEICDRGACGGCSVLLDGALVNACMMLAVDAVGRKVTTVEALS